MQFETKRAAQAPDTIAPDGSEVRLLCGLSAGGFALFSLPPGAVAKAVAHRTVEELWYVISGRGRMWRKLAGQEEIVDLAAGLSLSVPCTLRIDRRATISR
jgi:mannose-6-phosphate isomerase-like protein (cupin superfamily)